MIDFTLKPDKQKDQMGICKNNFNILSATTIREVDALRKTWKELNKTASTDIDYFIANINIRQNVIQPYVFLVNRGDLTESMLVGRIESKTIEFKIGYRVLFRSKVRALSIAEGGIVGKDSMTHCELMITEIMKIINSGIVEIVSFNEIPVESNLCNAARKMPGRLCKDYFPVINPHFLMSLPASIDDFFKTKKKRTRLKSLLKRLKKAYNNVEIKYFYKSDQIDILCRDIKEISQKTYQYMLDADGLTELEKQKLYLFLANRKWLRAYVLYIENKPCAFWSGLVYHGCQYGIAPCGTGYDPAYRKYEVGTILMLKMIEDLCNKNVKSIDFGPGDSPYKRRFCNRSWQESSFFIFSPTVRGLKLNAMRVFTEGIFKIGNKILSTFNLRERWEKHKRDRLKKLNTR